MNTSTLPTPCEHALLIGRLWLPQKGPVLVAVTTERVLDLSALALTCSDLLEQKEAAKKVRALISSGKATSLAATSAVLANTEETVRDATHPWFMAPCDLQAVKAAGVTFVASMLERVIEEQARGDASRAESVRAAVVPTTGIALRLLRAWHRER